MRPKAKKRAARLRAEASAITRRLESAVAINPQGPVLGRANIAYELAERTKGVATAAWG